MRRLIPALVVLGSLSLVACASDDNENEDTSSTESAIIGGATDTGDPAVVEFIQDVGDEEGGCTATFISTTVLISAAHCVVEDNNPKKIPANAKFKINMAPTEKDPRYVDIPFANVHPDPAYDGDAAHDISIIVLAKPENITPIPINRTPLTKADIGKPVTIVGYGNNKIKTGFGTKRTAHVTLRALTGSLVTIGNTGSQACEGDSGGPAFMTMNGVKTLFATDDVAATDEDCKQGDDYQRTDLQLAFIDQFLDK